MEKRVLLLADNANRDLLAVRLVEAALQRRGIRTALCTLHDAVLALRRFRPHAFVSVKGNLPITRQASRCCRVYILPGEGGQLTKETMLPTYVGPDYIKIDSADWIAKCYLWADAYRGWLLETGLFTEQQLAVTGNSKLDVYRSGIQRPQRTDRDFVVGVAFSAKSVSSYFGHTPFAENYFDYPPYVTFGVTHTIGRHVEDIIWKDHAILRLMMRFIRRFLDQEEGRILFRPAPLEDHRQFTFLQKRYPDKIRLAMNQPLADYLSSIDVLLTCYSTTGLEALIAGVPVISIMNTMDQAHLFRHISGRAAGFETFVPFYHTPDTEERLFELIARAREGRLPVSPKSKAEVDELLKLLYNWPYPTAASERVADDLVLDLETATDTAPAAWRQTFPLPYRIPMWLAPLAFWLKTIWFFIKKRSFKSMYNFYRTKDRQIDRWVRRVAAEIAAERAGDRNRFDAAGRARDPLNRMIAGR